MEKDFYNDNENEFSEVIDLLKKLPKIKAPENFEFNLSTRIQNGNFNLPQEKPISKWLTWGLGPITAMALSAIVFFFVISNSGFQKENLLMQNPELRQSTNVANNSGIQSNSKILNKEDEFSQSFSAKLKAIIEPNDVVVKSVQFPFNNTNSIDLDSYINGKKGNAQNNSNIKTVSSGPASINFNGFGILVKTSPEQLATMREKMDSLCTKNPGK